ncbi:hypothetical protein NOVO_00440 [Rickettsiales bacterium Ac37b]|nr:hypothetical protein NOVO_00440 [Rickettsiales bacterium Ac37b]
METHKELWIKLFLVAVGDLGIAPNHFWNMTIKELKILLNNRELLYQPKRITRTQLEILQKLFPDYEKST